MVRQRLVRRALGAVLTAVITIAAQVGTAPAEVGVLAVPAVGDGDAWRAELAALTASPQAAASLGAMEQAWLEFVDTAGQAGRLTLDPDVAMNPTAPVGATPVTAQLLLDAVRTRLDLSLDGAEPVFVSALSSPDARAVMDDLRALLDDPRAVQGVEPWVDVIRNGSAEALGLIGGPDLLPPLYALQAPNPFNLVAAFVMTVGSAVIFMGCIFAEPCGIAATGGAAILFGGSLLAYIGAIHGETVVAAGGCRVYISQFPVGSDIWAASGLRCATPAANLYLDMETYKNQESVKRSFTRCQNASNCTLTHSYAATPDGTTQCFISKVVAAVDDVTSDIVMSNGACYR